MGEKEGGMMKKNVLFSNFLICLLGSQLVQAKTTYIPEVVVQADRIVEEKSSISLKAEALPSQVQIITKEELENMPILHYLDIFRKVPGMYMRRYGEGDIADGIGMRGYTGGHGAQVGIFVDGVPVNVPHHSHTHGWADLGWLIPEMIERVEVIKGPFSALYGNFVLGGVVNIITKKSDSSSSISGEVGTYDSYRGVMKYANPDLKPSMFLVYEAHTKDGYRDRGDYERYNLFNKITFPLWGGDISVRAHYVKREWGFPGYIYLDEVQSGLRSRTDATSRSDGGDSEYMNLVFNYSPQKGEEGLHATMYTSNEKYQHFAIYQPDPQGWEPNERVFYGWNILYNFLPLKNLSLILGTDGRYDDGLMKQYDADERLALENNMHWDFKELTAGFFTQAQYKPIKSLKIMGGLRYDWFDFDIQNKVVPQNSGTGNTDILSPKFGLVFTPLKNLDIFANKGLGFRSSSANEMSPASSARNKNFDLKPARVDTWDIGLNTFLFDSLHLGLNYYYTEMEREVRRLGPDTINIGLSERKGFDLEVKHYISNNINIFGSYSYVDGRIKDPGIPQGQDKLRGIAKDTMTFGLEYHRAFKEERLLNLDILYTLAGKAPLNADGSVMRPSIDRYMVKASYKVGKMDFFINTTYTPDKYVSEGFFYWDPPRILYNPEPQWDISGGIKYIF
jgi:outer membrane receptor protein involved in Fe transport